MFRTQGSVHARFTRDFSRHITMASAVVTLAESPPIERDFQECLLRGIHTLISQQFWLTAFWQRTLLHDLVVLVLL